MNRQKGIFAVLVASFIIVIISAHAQETKQSEREALFSLYATKMFGHQYYLRMQLAEYIQGGIIKPHWMADGNSFWFVEGLPENTVIYVVDPMANTKKELFDTARLREELALVLGHTPPGHGLPFRDLTFLDQERKIKFKVKDEEFILELETYAITKAPPEKKQQFQRRRNALVSPDNLWIATIKDFNLWIRSTVDQGEIQITNDGNQDHYWSLLRAEWSPDSSTIALLKIDERNVQKIPIVSWLSTPEKVDWIHFPRAGETKAQQEIYFVNISSKQTLKVDKGEEGGHWIRILRWRPDGSELFYEKIDRRWKKAELMAANAIDGTSRIVLDEGVLPGVSWWPYRTFMIVPDGAMFVLRSEKDGWDHLFLYNYDGKLVRQLTKEPFAIMRLVTLDEKTGWLYFTGRDDPKRPYDTHLYRVNLDGEGFKRLTEATGKHDGPYYWTDPDQVIRFSPSKEFFIDTHSTMDRPPITELRKADGTFLQVLSKANIEILKEEFRWSPPEEFVAKAADGETDLYGAIYKPYDFNPDKKYPVIEIIHDGEAVQRNFIPWAAGWQAQALAHQGFIVFMVDVRGAEGRGRSFLNPFSGEDFFGIINDHVVALKQLASERPYMDLDRVGVLGYSAGGPLALIALLKAPDVYHVGIAGAPTWIDLYSCRARVAETRIGLPEESPDVYKKISLLQCAENLKGKLLLIHGTSDSACPLSHTMKIIDALTRTGKPYDLLIFPDEVHGLYTKPGNLTYYLQAIRRYFVEHLKPDME